MAITANSARAYTGLQANAEPTSEGTTGTLTIGQGQTVTTLTGATQAVVLAIEIDSNYTVALNLNTLVPTITGAGVAQVDTATAAGTITASGNATVVVTGDDITGSPLTVSVAVVNADTAATWAQKVRTALGAVSAITSKYTVGGTSTTITLTRTVARYNDSTLNISLANGTCTGITTAASSANTTAGVNPAKCYRISGTTYAGEDFEGADLPTVANYYGFQTRSVAGLGTAQITNSDGSFEFNLPEGQGFQTWSDYGDVIALDVLATPLIFTPGFSSGYCKLLVTFVFSDV
jgi:hypothetical protein